ncbi:DNA primase [Patescibacteria group bacterium]
MSGGVADDIKTKLDIAEVVSEYVQLKKAGTRLVGLCPFHNERTPSFSVSPDMGFWYCFGCSEGGDVFSFVQRVEGMEFIDALRVLAVKAGVELKQEDIGERNERQRLLEANRWAAKFFHEVLLRSPKAEHAREYVKRRALTQETTEDFMIGYAPDSWDATCVFLKKKGFTDEEIFKAGLSSRKDRGTGYFDRFRGRVMFPIKEIHGNVVGFTGRVLPLPGGKDPKDAKYVNTTQTAVYNKSGVLFGLDAAKQAIRKGGLAVIVEGNMDVIASHQAGVTHVVASSGTALTEEQLTLLKRLTTKIVLSFDTDEAGEKAARRGIDLAVAQGFSVRILRLPPDAGKDPDDCIRKDPELWKKAISEAIPYMEWYLALVKERVDFQNPDAKKEASIALIREVAKLPEPVERAHWVKELALLFSTPESLLFEKVESVRPGVARETPKTVAVSQKNAPQAPRQVSRADLLGEYLFGIVLAWPERIDAINESVDNSYFGSEFCELYSDFVIAYTTHRKHGSGTEQDFLRTFTSARSHEATKALARARLRAEQEFGQLSSDELKDAVTRLIGEITTLHKSRRKRELAQAMAQAEKAGDMDRITAIQNQLNELF